MLCFACDVNWPQFIRKNRIVVANKTCTGIVSSCKPLYNQMNVRICSPLTHPVSVDLTQENYPCKHHIAPLSSRSSTHWLLISPTKSWPRWRHHIFLGMAPISSRTFSTLIGQTAAGALSSTRPTVKIFLATQSWAVWDYLTMRSTVGLHGTTWTPIGCWTRWPNSPMTKPSTFTPRTATMRFVWAVYPTTTATTRITRTLRQSALEPPRP